ncbi:MAG: carboxypeptidase regulatory-like domain-containing protein [Acidobacteria bacterium]|nr:carboxypeptidase regulatory-like domain-containing protein [Acidobacteriota bacterium]
MKLLVFVTFVTLAFAQMPVKRVVLYKNGVGYFEHQGTVEGKQDVSVSFTSGQLNDVLKSLTVLDLNGGKISGIGYDAAQAADRRLGEIRLPVGEKGSLNEFLTAMRGARIEVRNGGAPLEGRLVSVERKTRAGVGATLEVEYVTLLTASGELRTAEISPAFSVRLIEPGLAGKVGQYLDVLATSRDADVRKMVISADGAGRRNLFVSYISEVPVWKATYRMVLGSKPLLQGWAIVDNTVGQDWENVSLSLVAGAPQSFVQNLAQPQYARRPVVALSETTNRAPQTFSSGILLGRAQLAGIVTDAGGAAIPDALVEAFDESGAVIAKTATNNAGAYSFSNLLEGAVRLEVSRPGFVVKRLDGVQVASGASTRRNVELAVGSVTDSMTVAGSAPMEVNNSMSVARPGQFERLRQFSQLQTAPKVTFSEARTQSQTVAQAQELGDLFEYRIEQPVTIAKNRSALVPILQSPVDIEKVTIWSSNSGRPQRALWLTNSTKLTLDGGTFSVVEAEAFAGEGILEAIRPAEKRLLTYATDLAVSVTTAFGSQQQKVSRVVVSKGIMVHQSSVTEKRTYTIRNNDAAARTMLIEHPVRAGYQLKSATSPAETTATEMRFRVAVPARETVAFPIEEARTMSTNYSVVELQAPTFARFVTDGSLPPAVEQALQGVMNQKAIVAGFQQEIKQIADEGEKIEKAQERVRENLKALKGSAEEKALVQRYTRQLDEQETRLAQLEKQGDAVTAKLKAEQEELNRRIGAISLDVTL